MTVVFVVFALACEPDSRSSAGTVADRAGGADSIVQERAKLASELQSRIVFLLSTLPNAPQASVSMGALGDTTFAVSIDSDTNHIAPRLIMEDPTLVAHLRRVGYGAVSFRQAGRVIVLPLRAETDSVAVAPPGAAGEAARRIYADSVATRLREAGVDARARGVEREILFVDGLSGSADVALGYANALAGGLLRLDRLRALRFTRMIVAGPKRSWCWNLVASSTPKACGNDEIDELQ